MCLIKPIGEFMKKITVITIALSFGVSVNVWAVCPSISNPIQVNQISTLLSGTTVCVSNPKGQEYHQGTTSGQVIDYKHGPKCTKPSDTLPTAIGCWNDWTDQVGNWSVKLETIDQTIREIEVQYDYDRNGVYEYSYSVYGTNTGTEQSPSISAPYEFCNSSTNITGITLRSGNVPQSCD